MSTPEQQLQLRALRMLTDAREHDERALRWAAATTELRRAVVRVDMAMKRCSEAMERLGFNVRELSLGAEPDHE